MSYRQNDKFFQTDRMLSRWLYILFSLLRLEIEFHNFDIVCVKMDVCHVSFVDFFHERGDYASSRVLAGIIKNNVGILHSITSTGKRLGRFSSGIFGFVANMHYANYVRMTENIILRSCNEIAYLRTLPR